jgi:hypothetical protein
MSLTGLFCLRNFISALSVGGCGFRLIYFDFGILFITLLFLGKFDLIVFDIVQWDYLAFL